MARDIIVRRLARSLKNLIFEHDAYPPTRLLAD
jgi:hypothetical protein